MFSLESIRGDGQHELEILRLLFGHGEKGYALVFLRADNFQRLYNVVASALALDPSMDRAHLVSASVLYLHTHLSPTLTPLAHSYIGDDNGDKAR